MIPYSELKLNQPYFVNVKRNNQPAIVTLYGAGRWVERVKGTDPNCFNQQLTDYDFIRPLEIPADVWDECSTLRTNTAAVG